MGTHLDNALRDQLIWDIKDNHIKKRLLLEEKLNLKKCVELCVSIVAATNDVNQAEVLFQESSRSLPAGRVAICTSKINKIFSTYTWFKNDSSSQQ